MLQYIPDEQARDKTMIASCWDGFLCHFVPVFFNLQYTQSSNNAFVRKIKILLHISMLKTENFKVVPNHILPLSRYKERFVCKASVEMDRTVLCILAIN